MHAGVVPVNLRKNVPGLPNIGSLILGFEVGHYQAAVIVADTSTISKAFIC